MGYRLMLTDEDVRTIAFVGGRYAWSEALAGYGPGEHDISEADTWELAAAFEEDMEGGHSMFPMLAAGPLRRRLALLYVSIV